MQSAISALDALPWSYVIIACLTLGLAPFFPEPHIWEKLKMLASGTLVRPLDIFDMFLHAAPFLLALAKAEDAGQRNAGSSARHLRHVPARRALPAGTGKS